MASLSITPHYDDMVTLKQLVTLLEKTGHPKSETTLRAWIARWDVPTERRGRSDRVWVSYTRMLQIHRDDVMKRDGV